jgi:hypothetical protein
MRSIGVLSSAWISEGGADDDEAAGAEEEDEDAEEVEVEVEGAVSRAFPFASRLATALSSRSWLRLAMTSPAAFVLALVTRCEGGGS